MGLPTGATWQVIVSTIGTFFAIFLFCFFYIRRYRNPYETNVSTFLTSCFALFVVLLATALSPIDIFIASIMKTPDGNFKPWAKDLAARNDIETDVLYGYYLFYAVIFVCLFILLPFMYFYFEEMTENEDFDDEPRSQARFCSALRYTLCFMMVAFVLLLCGIFVPMQSAPSTNSTEWEKIKNMFEQLSANKYEDAISMVLSVVSTLGIVNLIFYAGFGISSWPIGLIRGQKSTQKQHEEIQDRSLVNQSRINALREKQRIVGRLNPREMAMLGHFESEQRDNTLKETVVDQHRASWTYKCRYLIRPFEIAIGVVGLILSLLIWVSLLLTNIDKALHSPGYRMGYVLSKRTLFNPLDYVLVQLQAIFPLDYVLFLIIAWFLILCTISGIRNLGVRLFFVRMFKLRYKHTSPQGLLLTCAILMLTTLGINILFFCISPQYVTFGNQYYLNTSNSTKNGTEHLSNGLDSHMEMSSLISNNNATLMQCNNQAAETQCTMTRNSYLLLRFLYKAWYFGVFYYFASWFFLLLTLCGFIYACARKSRALTDTVAESDDFEESDEDTWRLSGSRRNDYGSRSNRLNSVHG